MLVEHQERVAIFWDPIYWMGDRWKAFGVGSANDLRAAGAAVFPAGGHAGGRLKVVLVFVFWRGEGAGVGGGGGGGGVGGVLRG